MFNTNNLLTIIKTLYKITSIKISKFISFYFNVDYTDIIKTILDVNFLLKLIDIPPK